MEYLVNLQYAVSFSIGVMNKKFSSFSKLFGFECNEYSLADSAPGA